MNSLSLYIRSRRSLRYAEKQGLPGTEFARFGIHMGWRLLWRRGYGGWGYLICPVQSTRFFEFAFAQECLADSAGSCLDISSPRLFSLFLARTRSNLRISILNPDCADIDLTERIVRNLNIPNTNTMCADIKKMSNNSECYDIIWSLSVIEHINGEYDDRTALEIMWRNLRPGGKLILTVPVDRIAWDEYRDKVYYNLETTRSGGKYFFQRFYDGDSISKRIIDVIGLPPIRKCWFGEIEPGHFHQHVRNWLAGGLNYIVDDPREMADHYRVFDTWEQMPGVGVCGLMFLKDHARTSTSVRMHSTR